MIRGVYGDLMDDDGVIDMTVRYNGTWQKRGFTARHGVGVAIEVQTGLVVDYEVLSNYCHTCALAEKKFGRHSCVSCLARSTHCIRSQLWWIIQSKTKRKMAFNVAKLLNSDASDWAQIDSLIEEYFLEEVTDESVADDDEDDNFANYITDEDDDFDFRQNDYDTAMHR